MIERMDHAVVAVASTAAAAAPYERLGLRVGAPVRHAGLGSESRVFFVGARPDQSFYVELFGIFDPEQARAAGRSVYLDAIARGGGLTRVMLKVAGLAALVDGLQRRGVHTPIEEIWMGDRKMADLAILGAIPDMAIDAGLFEPPPDANAFARRAAEGRFSHDFPLKRFDHLAAITADLEASTRFWSEALGVTVHGEVRRPGAIIRQLKMGDGILELIGSDGSPGHVASRPPGLISMLAWEVPDLDEAVALARERGFTPNDPGTGVLPGTRTATIPGGELAGVAMQLMQYV
ncbi:MAG: VOC family protein [Tepidiformaceae bacterium]